MKKKLIIASVFIIVLIFFILAFSGVFPSPPLKYIQKSISIPSSSGFFSSSAGTLYCRGTIIETTEGVEHIELAWEADVTFPGDGVAGWFEWDDIFNSLYWPGVMAPSPDLQQKWCFAEGEHHIWKMILIIYPYSVEFHAYVDAGLIRTETSDHTGFYDMKDGYHEVYSAFASEPTCTDLSIFEMERYLETEKFKMVKTGDNIWFE